MADKNKMKCNQPQRTPSHPTKSHMVKACQGGEERLIRFGQQGVKGSPPRENESEAAKARRLAFKERHDCDKQTDKFSAAYWSCKFKW